MWKVLNATTVFLALCSSSGVTMAQQPTQAQRDEIRNSCRSDFMSNCSSVTPGGVEALHCLQQNSARLSGACRNAVNAINPRPAQPASPAAPPAEAPACRAHRQGASQDGGRSTTTHQPTARGDPHGLPKRLHRPLSRRADGRGAGAAMLGRPCS